MDHKHESKYFVAIAYQTIGEDNSTAHFLYGCKQKRMKLAVANIM